MNAEPLEVKIDPNSNEILVAPQTTNPLNEKVETKTYKCSYPWTCKLCRYSNRYVGGNDKKL